MHQRIPDSTNGQSLDMYTLPETNILLMEEIWLSPVEVGSIFPLFTSFF